MLAADTWKIVPVIAMKVRKAPFSTGYPIPIGPFFGSSPRHRVMYPDNFPMLGGYRPHCPGLDPYVYSVARISAGETQSFCC